MTEGDDCARPSGAVEAGEYNCTWNIDGQVVQGTIELAGGKFPHGTAQFMLEACRTRNGWAFPRREDRDRVTGYIAVLGRTIVLIGVKMATQWPNITQIDADYALVGRGSTGIKTCGSTRSDSRRRAWNCSPDSFR